jgi:hypothetical protein
MKESKAGDLPYFILNDNYSKIIMMEVDNVNN